MNIISWSNRSRGKDARNQTKTNKIIQTLRPSAKDSKEKEIQLNSPASGIK
jgi:hypothetical protein